MALDTVTEHQKDKTKQAKNKNSSQLAALSSLVDVPWPPNQCLNNAEELKIGWHLRKFMCAIAQENLPVKHSETNLLVGKRPLREVLDDYNKLGYS